MLPLPGFFFFPCYLFIVVVCVYYVYIGASWRLEEALDSLELEAVTVVSYCVCVLGTEPSLLWVRQVLSAADPSLQI